jgi:hypothetical protein
MVDIDPWVWGRFSGSMVEIYLDFEIICAD